jgi:uncharacterized SAM-binding protein YcdF (DUF218 family)/glycosyltransferase involved in cell wall biosynthesis
MNTTRHDIICISSIDWDFIWQGHQEIMSTFAADGHRVLFIENTGVRSPRVRDLPRLGHRLRNWWGSTQGFRQERENLFVYSPIVVPLPYSRLARWVNRVLIMRALRRWMGAVGVSRPIVWTFLPTPLALSLIRALDPKLCVYYCIDDFASSSAQAQRIVASEREVMREADLVFVTSEKLRQRAARDARAVHLFPFGVSLKRFEEARAREEPPPADMASLARPVVGYIGGLHQWFDQELVANAARHMPDATFALVGPEQTDVRVLRRCPNVRLLGPRTHDELPKYVKAFDVGIVPYRLSEYTTHVYPTKLNEYLAMGLPVVTSDLAEVQRFNRENGGIVAIAPDADAFVAELAKAVNGGGGEDVRAKRIEVARRNSWSARIAEMWTLMDRVLAEREGLRDGWDIRLRRLYRTTRRRTIQIVLGVVAAYFLIFQTTFVWWLASPLDVSAPPEPADAIVVFAGGVGESGQAGGGYQERVAAAVDLYRAGYARHLVLSSGFRFVFREAEIMRDLAVANGVPAEAIVLEETAANTHEMVAASSAILRRQGWKKILFVSSPYHMRRALLAWRGTAPDVTVVPTPVHQSLFYLHERGPSLDQIRGIVHEYAAIPFYWWRGWI